MNSKSYCLLFYRQNHFMYPAGLLAALLLSACMPPQKQNYETMLFDTGRVHTVEVNIAPEDWQDLLAHPEEKTKYEVDLIIDGEEISQVSFSTKGNSSLAFAANNRYSFKINFGKYVKGQTWQAQREVILRRAENVRRQLSGTLVSRTKQQNPADRVDTSDIDLAVLKTGQRQ